MKFITSPETQSEITSISALLAELQEGETLSYADASEAIGRDVQLYARQSLTAARQKIETENGVRFETVYKEGVKRIALQDVASIGAVSRKRTRRITKKAFARLNNLRAENISDETRDAINSERVALGAILHFTSDKSVRKIAEEVKRAGEIPLGKTLAMFTK